MTTAWEKLVTLSGTTAGTAWSRFNAITNSGVGTVIVNGYSIDYTIPVYSIDIIPNSNVEISTSIIDILLAPQLEALEIQVESPSLLVNSNDSINIEVI